MIRTRVGYSGGKKANPTYRSLGNHTEMIQIDYDPTQITYEDLLKVFWTGHSPTARSWSRQYRAVAFYHNDEQKAALEKTRGEVQTHLGSKVHTAIEPAQTFYLAENYHQKYRLRGDRELMREFAAMLPDNLDFINSTAAARVNGIVAGFGTKQLLEKEIESYGLSEAGKQRLLKALGIKSSAFCPAPQL